MTSVSKSGAARRRRASSQVRRPTGVLDLACAALCSAAAVLVLCGVMAKWVWAADVVSLFRPYCVIASVLVLLVCLAGRRWGFILIALALLAGEFALMAAPSLRGDAHLPGSSSGRELTVITFNCLGSNPNSRTAVAWFRRMRPDILVLEELPSSWEGDLDTLADILPYRASQLQTTRSDTDVFSRLQMTSADAYKPALDLRTLIHATVVMDGRRLQVFGIHPNTLQTQEEWTNRNNALELSAQWVAQTRRSGGGPGAAGRHDPALVLGDWNTPPWSPYFHAFLSLSGLKSVDGVLWPAVTRVLAAPMGVRIGSPIDHVAASSDVQADGCETGPDLGSDHVPQICRIRLGPG